MKLGAILFRWTLAVLLIGGSGLALARYIQDSDLVGRYGAVEVLRPTASPKAMVIVFQDPRRAKQGENLARALTAAGALVAVVDTTRYQQQLQRQPLQCSGLAEDAERISQRLLRAERVDRFLRPILIGEGEGAILARQTMAAAAPEMFSGAVVADTGGLSDALACPQHPPTAEQGFFKIVAADAPEAFVAAVRPHLRSTSGIGLVDLPLLEMPAPHSDRLVILISGDGGWREIDKGISARLRERGVSVVGWDSLRYFWSSRTPTQVGDDLDRVIAEYQLRWHARHVALVGYSFGADVMPFAYAKLAPPRHEAVQFVTLLGLGHEAAFKVRIGGWLGWHNDTSLPVAPALVVFDPQRLQCVYGVEEKDTLCPELRGRGVQVIARLGGHHFDRNPIALADGILAGWDRVAAGARTVTNPLPTRTAAAPLAPLAQKMADARNQGD